MYNETLCTLADAKQQVKTQQNTDDSAIFDAVRDAAARISEYIPIPLEPYIETRYYDACRPPVSYNGRVLTLDWPLLSASSVALGDGTALAVSDYQLNPLTEPAVEIVLTSDTYSFYAAPQTTTNRTNIIQVAGTWGQRNQYARAWTNAAILNGNINDSITTLDVNSAWDISAGALLRIDSEYMRVLEVNSLTLTVQRGENGSAAAAHTTGATIGVYRWEPAIRRAAARLSAWLYHRRGNFENSQFDVGTGTTTQYPNDMPNDVANVIRAFVSPSRIRQSVIW